MRPIAYGVLLSATALLLGCGGRTASMVQKSAPAAAVAHDVANTGPTPAFVQPLTETPAIPPDVDTANPPIVAPE